MDEDRKRVWDVAIGIVGPVLTVAGLLVGVWQFNRGEHNRIVLENELIGRKDEVDFHRQLWVNRVDIYRALLTLTGRIVATAADKGPKDPGLADLSRDLTASYWSQSIIVEDTAVAARLQDFYTTVRDFRDGWANADKVKLKAEALARACRASIEGSAPLGAKP